MWPLRRNRYVPVYLSKTLKYTPIETPPRNMYRVDGEWEIEFSLPRWNKGYRLKVKSKTSLFINTFSLSFNQTLQSTGPLDVETLMFRETKSRSVNRESTSEVVWLVRQKRSGEEVFYSQIKSHRPYPVPRTPYE